MINLTIDNYKLALEALQYYKINYAKNITDSKSRSLPFDSNCVFVLYCLSMINKNLADGNTQEAIKIANIAALDSF